MNETVKTFLSNQDLNIYIIFMASDVMNANFHVKLSSLFVFCYNVYY